MTSGRWRLDPNDIKALALAPLLPAGVLVLFDAASRVLAFGPLAIVGALLFGFYLAIVMEAFALVFGIPLLLLLRRHLHLLPLCIVVGAVIASIPASLLAFSAPLPDFASSDGIPTVIRGVRTHHWYVETASLIAMCMGFGAIGGGAFWWLRRRGGSHG